MEKTFSIKRIDLKTNEERLLSPGQVRWLPVDTSHRVGKWTAHQANLIAVKFGVENLVEKKYTYCVVPAEGSASKNRLTAEGEPFIFKSQGKI